MKKVLISVDEDLLANIDGYAKEMHLSSRSASIAVLCSTALQNKRSISTLDKFIQAYLERTSS